MILEIKKEKEASKELGEEHSKQQKLQIQMLWDVKELVFTIDRENANMPGK